MPPKNKNETGTPGDLDLSTDAPPTPPPGAPPAPPGTPTPATELLTPDEWARRKGLIVERTGKTPWVEPHANGFHAEAAQLHGWAAYAYAEQAPAKALRLSEADYDAALKAAAAYPAAPAHAAAMAPGMKPPPLPAHIQAALDAKAKAEGSKPSGD